MPGDDILFKPGVLKNKGPGKAAFLARVRAALGADGATSLPPAGHPIVRDALYRQVSREAPTSELISRYTTAARAVGMKVELADSGGVLEALDRCLSHHTIKQVLLNAGPFAEKYYLPDHLAGQHIKTSNWGDPQCRAAAWDADAAITDCRWAMADNGGILVWSDSSFGRSSTLTMPVHVVLLPASKILPDLADAFARLIGQTQGDLPSNVVIISGPSKTADIEMNLVTGVHGPKYVYVIVIQDL